MDEEGFMQDIERFTKQHLEVQVIPGFEPEPGERAEPIAMGRQTIWGGAGKPPSRDVMQAAAKAARTEMLQRVREKKSTGGPGAGPRGPRNGPGNGPGNGPSNGPGYGQGNGPRNGPPRQGAGRNGPHRPPRDSGYPRDPGFPRDAGFPRDDDGPMAHEDQPPRSHDARAHQNRNPLANPTMKNFPSEPRVPRAPGGQPDPMRTSVDMMAERGARRGGGGGGGYQGKRPNGGGGGFGGAPGGFGGGPRGRGGPGGGNRGPAR